MNRAKVYSINTINGTIELDVAGAYFKLMTSPARAVDVELVNDGNQALSAGQVSAGFYQRIPFTKVRLTDTGAQAVTILVAPDEGGSDNFTGTFTAQGTLGTLAQQLVGGVNELVVMERGYAYGSAAKSNTSITAGTSEQVFAPGSNTNGAIVWRASGTSANATNAAGLSLIAHTAAPNSPTVGDVLAVGAAAVAAGIERGNVTVDRPIFVAAGKGLYWNVSTTETSGYRQVLYTLL